ncbi:MAG: hypothetical protein J6Y94_08055 [Bacteriovoracaceae bacterium]|nr:hypothetical protein [Bacteriovoracaceae bacterium]
MLIRYATLLLLTLVLSGKAAEAAIPSSSTAQACAPYLLRGNTHYTAGVHVLKKAEYPAYMAQLKKRSFLEQLMVGQIEVARPEDGFRVGNFFLEQLGKYWAQEPRLAQEVAVEISPSVNSIIELDGYFVPADATARELLTQQEVTILGQGKGALAHRMARLKYIGPRKPQTVLGAYLQQILNPRGIDLIFDPQSSIIAGISAAFGKSNTARPASLTVGPEAFYRLLTAPDVAHLQQSHILEHELGHHQIFADLQQGKIPLVASKITLIFETDDPAAIRNILEYVTSDPNFAFPLIVTDEFYTYNISLRWILEDVFRKLHKEVFSTSDLIEIHNLIAAAKAALRVSGQELWATYLVSQVGLNRLRTGFAQGDSWFSRDTRNGQIALVSIMKKDGEFFTVEHGIPTQLIQHPVLEQEGNEGDIYHDIQLDPRDTLRVQQFLQQQGEYLKDKSAAVLETIPPQLDQLLSEVKEVLDNPPDAQKVPFVTRVQHWKAQLTQLCAKAADLSKYPPYFKESEK